MAYIVNQDEEQRGPVAAQGGSFAGGSQAGVSRGTGGSKPWVNIQNYLGANPQDQSAARVLQSDFGDPLAKEASGIDKYYDGLEKSLSEQRSGLESAKSASEKALSDARNVYSTQLRTNLNPNYSSGLRQQAVSGFDVKPPELQAPSLSSGLQEQYSKLQDPYGYLSQRLQGRGLSAGQRALQEQLTRKNTQFPSLTAELQKQYSDTAKKSESSAGAAAKNIEALRADASKAKSTAEQRASQYDADLNAIQRAILNPAGQNFPLFQDVSGGRQPLGWVGPSESRSLLELAQMARSGAQSSGSADAKQRANVTSDLIGSLLKRYGF